MRNYFNLQNSKFTRYFLWMFLWASGHNADHTSIINIINNSIRPFLYNHYLQLFNSEAVTALREIQFNFLTPKIYLSSPSFNKFNSNIFPSSFRLSFTSIEVAKDIFFLNFFYLVENEFLIYFDGECEGLNLVNFPVLILDHHLNIIKLNHQRILEILLTLFWVKTRLKFVEVLLISFI